MILQYGEDKGWAEETWRSEEFERAGRYMNRNKKPRIPKMWIILAIILLLSYLYSEYFS